MLPLPSPDLRGLLLGEVVVTAVERASLSEGDEVELSSSGHRSPEDVKPAYRRWLAATPPSGPWYAVVVAVHPAQLLDAESGSARHLLAAPPQGDLVVLRVYGPEGPVLSDVAFAARVQSLEGALRT